MRRPSWAILGSVLVLFLFLAEEGRASSFNVSPLKIVLSGKTSSALLEITNQSPDALRLQLSVSAWDQRSTGEILLSPTDEVILFPPLVSIEPGEKRKIRLGAVTPRGVTEKTYRIVLEELPPAKSHEAEGGVIHVLTRMTIPVFLEPTKKVVSGEIADLTLRNGTASFAVKNTGNAHFSPQRIELIGAGASGQPIAKHDIDGWYVLAGSTRAYDIRLSTEECRNLKSLTVEAQSEAGPLKAQLDVNVGDCGP
ncbi:MAG TPA: fimbria/pilus periplasmic chaperone [Nitrospira sp.]|nr:fimbria/pilus periplasmic chaperone [Nitrospira sp.]